MPPPETTPTPVLDSSLELRQDANFYIITQTLTRQSTTITTLVTLGSTAPTSSSADTPSPQLHRGLTGAEIGAILGSVVGLVVLAIIIGLCYASARRTRPIDLYDDTSSRTTTSSYMVDETYHSSSGRPSTVPLQEPLPVAERIPGGPRHPTYRAIPIPNPRSPQIRRVS